MTCRKKRSIIARLFYRYQVFRLVKFIDKECEEKSKKLLLSIQAGKKLSKKDKEIGVDAGEALVDFSKKRIFFRKPTSYRISQLCATALQDGYLIEDNELLSLLENGVKLTQGIPLIRFGLWKAWYEDEGWLVAILGTGYFVTLAGLTRKAAELALKFLIG